MWITSDGRFNKSVTELNASDGSLIRVIKARAYGFNESTGAVASGAKRWILNASSVTELDSHTGSLVRVVRLSIFGSGSRPPVPIAAHRRWLVLGPQLKAPLDAYFAPIVLQFFFNTFTFKHLYGL